MKGYQVTFYAVQGRKEEGKRVEEWLSEIGKSIGIGGVTTTMASEGSGRDGKLHSARFFELADQPIEITMATTVEQCEALFRKLEEVKANLFYVRTEVDFGVVGERPD